MVKIYKCIESFKIYKNENQNGRESISVPFDSIWEKPDYSSPPDIRLDSILDRENGWILINEATLNVYFKEF